MHQMNIHIKVAVILLTYILERLYHTRYLAQTLISMVIFFLKPSNDQRDDHKEGPWPVSTLFTYMYSMLEC